MIWSRIGWYGGCRSFYKFWIYIIGLFLLFFKFWVEKIGEKEDLEDGKHDEKFDENYCPERSSERHILKTFFVKIVNISKPTGYIEFRIRHVFILHLQVICICFLRYFIAAGYGEIPLLCKKILFVTNIHSFFLKNSVNFQ